MTKSTKILISIIDVVAMGSLMLFILYKALF